MTVANPTIMQAVEQLGYRVTVGDVATQAGLEINLAEQGLLALASEVGGHLQVAESGEIAYQFPRQFRAVLRNKYWRLRFQEWWEKVWRVLFYLIRISFGILLVLSILAILVAISVIVISISASGGSSGGDNRDRSSGGGFFFMPSYWISDLFWIFNPNYGRRGYSRSRRRQSTGSQDPNSMSFLEAIYSFLFGDGNPNANLEQRRWQDIATVIRNNQGAVVAEQLAPYLDNLGSGYANEYEEYMLPVLTRFNGRPEVSPEGGLVYHFPELQTTATKRQTQAIPEYLKEFRWQFSAASSGQIMLAIGLGAVNCVGALVLGSLLADGAIAAQLGGFIAFVESIYGILLGYGIAFLVIPLIRYFWNSWRNSRIESRNQQRETRAKLLQQPNSDLQQKMLYARKFAVEKAIGTENLAYTTETDLLEQEIEHSDRIDAEWQRRLSDFKDNEP